MPSDIRLAFAHPEARAEATAAADPPDRISLRDHVAAADIGAFQEERGRPQRLSFDIVAEVQPRPQPLADDVDRILSYDCLVAAVAAELAAGRVDLLETLAERIAARVLAAPQALRAFVRIQKLDRGPGALGVEIVRSRAAAPPPAAATARPLVVHLDDAAIGARDLPRRLDGWESRGAPVVLTVGMPGLPRPRTGHGPTQWRIDLLALEQNAWRLAARDPRCLVVASRTELDRAIGQGRTVVWAPSRLVLDAADAPRRADPAALALWLAARLQAARLILPRGARLPAGAPVPVERADR